MLFVTFFLNKLKTTASLGHALYRPHTRIGCKENASEKKGVINSLIMNWEL